MKHLVTVICLLICFNCSAIGEKENIPEHKVVKAILSQMKKYPESHLVDIYKNFFQDRFGPGHIISDTSSAGKYLRAELTQMRSEMSASESAHLCNGKKTGNIACRKIMDFAEPTGYDHNFYRIDLYVIIAGLVPYDVYFRAFIESVNGIKPPCLQDWITEWHSIKEIIDKMHLNLPNYEHEAALIEDGLQKGDYVWHHSKDFDRIYKPHYRIISKEILRNFRKRFCKPPISPTQ